MTPPTAAFASFAPVSGQYKGVPETLYHSTDLASQSTLKRRVHGHAWAKIRHDMVHPPPPTNAQIVGSALHVRTLQPELYSATVKPAFSGKGAVQARKDWIKEHAGQIILSQDDYDTVERMAEAVQAHPAAHDLLAASGPFEWTIVDDIDGLPCKIRIDHYVEGEGFIVDLKSTIDASKDAFEKAILNFGYHHQAGFYTHAPLLHGVAENAFIVICVEKTPPYLVAVRNIVPSVIEQGWTELQDAIAEMKQCYASNEWPGYSNEVEDVGLPPWAMPSQISVADTLLEWEDDIAPPSRFPYHPRRGETLK